jgi:peptide subunit release factor 1 (eRF1)
MSSQQQGQGGEAEKNIEIWKVKKLIKRLESARGNGTSMISLIIRMFFPANAYIGDPFAVKETTSPLTIIYSPQGSDLSRCEDVG